MSDDREIFDLVRDAIISERDQFPRHVNDADSGDVTDAVLLELTRRALDEQAESVIRWLDPDREYQTRIEAARRTVSE